MSLAAIQRDFRSWLQTGSPESAASFDLRATPGLGIYLNNFRSQLVACLEDSFTKTRLWIGEDAFQQAVVRHVDRVPPSSWTLDAYPKDFPETLALLYPDDPEIAELAGLEFMLAEAFIAADALPLDSARVASVDWDVASLIFTPTLDLCPLKTNAPAIWTALAEQSEPPAPEQLPEASALLVWRQGETPRFRTIATAEHQALSQMRAGAPFAGLCARLVGEIGEEAGIALAGTWLGQWLKDELVVAIVEGL